MDLMQILKQYNIDINQAQQAWQQAKQMASGVETKEQAMNLLNKKGIDRAALEKIGGYINSPIADVIAKAANVNIDKVRRDFNSFVGGENTTKSHNSLDKYRKGLKQL